MTPAELIEFATNRHGEESPWVPLAAETGYSVSHLWRCAYEERPISAKLEKTLRLLRPVRRSA